MHMHAEVPIPHDFSVGDLREILAEGGIPDTAKIDIHVTPRDRPFDSETKTLKFAWDT